MTRSTLITGLDIGSSKIAACACEVAKDNMFKILAQEVYPSRGFSRGTFVNLGEAVGAVSKVLEKIRTKISKRGLENIYVNITGDTIKDERSKGMIPISLRGREITKADIDKCINVASTIQLPFDRDIVHTVVQNFSIDDEPLISNPLGLYASRLACEVYIVSASVNHIQNIYKCVNDAGYDVKEVVFTGIANGESLVDERGKEEGVALLDIGDSVTEISIFSSGSLRDMDVIVSGVRDFRGDFKDSIEFKNILVRTRSRIEAFLNNGGKVGSIVLTGGVAFADEIIEVLEAHLPCQVKTGVVKEAKGEVSGLDSMRAATAIGLARYAYKRHVKKVVEEKNIVSRISTKVVDIFNNYF